MDLDLSASVVALGRRSELLNELIENVVVEDTNYNCTSNEMNHPAPSSSTSQEGRIIINLRFFLFFFFFGL